MGASTQNATGSPIVPTYRGLSISVLGCLLFPGHRGDSYVKVLWPEGQRRDRRRGGREGGVCSVVQGIGWPWRGSLLLLVSCFLSAQLNLPAPFSSKFSESRSILTESAFHEMSFREGCSLLPWVVLDCSCLMIRWVILLVLSRGEGVAIWVPRSLELVHNPGKSFELSYWVIFGGLWW